MGATKRRRWMTIFIVACGSVFMFLRENRVVTSDLSLLKLEQLARNSMQNRTGDFDVRPGMRSSGFISSYDRQILTQLDKTKDIWLRQDKERQAVLEKKVSICQKQFILFIYTSRGENKHPALLTSSSSSLILGCASA